MATGTYEFIVPVARLRLEQTEVANPHPSVEKILIETRDDERMTVVFHLTDVFTETEADAVTTDILASIINRLAFELDLSIGEPHFRRFSLPKDASGSSYTVSSGLLVMWDVAAPVIVPGDTRRQELARLLEQPSPHPDLYSAYRFAGNQSDAVARFMFFYNILLQLHNDSQRQVDDFIRKETPTVSQSLSPRNPPVMETVYTRLRNEVGHIRLGVTPEQTRTEIEDNVAALRALVKVAISHVV
jgi:hypothetical protein